MSASRLPPGGNGVRMLDDNDETSGFKVVDRRAFKEDGEPRPSEPEKAQLSEGPAAAGPAEAPEEMFSDQATGEAPSGFATLVSYLSTTAMFQLGLLPGPGGERLPVDLVNARMTIDLLDVLQEKTEGNLTENESRLLDEVLYELRLSFVEVQKRATQATK